MGGQVKYYRITKTLNDVGKLIPFNQNVYDVVKDQNTDYYTSLFYYDDEHKRKSEEIIERVKGDKTIKRKRGVAGFTDVKTDRLVFDFDSEDKIEIAQTDTVELCKRLQENGFELDKDVIIAFSGNKGFSVEALLEDEYTPDQIKKLASNLASDLESFDSKIYNASRVFRVTGTKHAKTGLYKTPISFEELKSLSIGEIKEMAKEAFIVEPPRRFKLPESLNVTATTVEKKTTPKTSSSPDLELDFSKKPKNLSHWKYALLHGFFPNGCRSYALMILASTYKAQGYPKEVTYRMLKGAVELQNVRHGGGSFDSDEIWNNVIEQIYSPLWNGGTYAEETFPDELKEYLTNLNIPSKIENIEDVFQNTNNVFSSFKNFAENIDANTIRTGVKPLDALGDFRITTGMLVGLLGAPSSGKTTVSLEIMKNVSLNNEQVAFFSMDMGANLVFHRLAQKVSGLNGDALLGLFKDSEKNKDQINEIKEQIDEQFANVNFSFKTAMTTQTIRESILALQEKTGKKVRLAVVDYLECISSTTSDPTAKISMISQELKDIANDLDICVLLLLQPPKRVGDPSKEILSYTDIKGAATVAQAASIILSLWRDGFNPKTIDHDNYISFAVVKNRMGKLAQVDCGWDGLTGKVTHLDQIEREELHELRKAKENQEEDQFS